MFDRGFTGHEHLPQFGLINMNGRVYDPFLARFLSPDPYVQAPDYSQNFNRYSYAFNNPLKYSDPDGEWVHLVVGAAIGGVFNWLSNGAQFNAKGLGYFGVGALAGALGAGIGAGFGALASGAGTFGFSASAGLSTVGFGAGFASGTGAGFASGLVTGTGNSLVNGDSFSKAMNSGLNSAFWGGTIGGITGGISGGVRARRMGNDFWSGGAISNKRSKPVIYSFEHFRSSDRIENGCFAMTLGELDPNNDANYYKELIDSFYKDRGFMATSMKSDFIDDFFSYAGIDSEKIGFFNGLVTKVPNSDYNSVFGFTARWGRSGHAMPVYRLKLWPDKYINGIPKFKIYFNDFGSRFVLNNRNVNLFGFYFRSVTF
jgi:RHS repeat-associated protein